jgi:hypothetical protein
MYEHDISTYLSHSPHNLLGPLIRVNPSKGLQDMVVWETAWEWCRRFKALVDIHLIWLKIQQDRECALFKLLSQPGALWILPDYMSHKAPHLFNRRISPWIFTDGTHLRSPELLKLNTFVSNMDWFSGLQKNLSAVAQEAADQAQKLAQQVQASDAYAQAKAYAEQAKEKAKVSAWHVYPITLVTRHLGFHFLPVFLCP